MTPTALYVDPILSYLACIFSVEHVTDTVASYNNDMISKFHKPVLTLSHKESKLDALDVKAVDSQTL